MRLPTVMVPYPGPAVTGDTQDVTLYVRPESNLVEVEAAILSSLRPSSRFGSDLELIYLANLPGDFMLAHQVVGRHNADRVAFARRGGEAFTPWMRGRFSQLTGVAFDQERVVGGFVAGELVGMTPEQLFALRVPENEFWILCGQQIKRYGELFLVNPDVPALLRKISTDTNIFSLVVRSGLPAADFAELVRKAGAQMAATGLVPAEEPISHVFHYSKGPLEGVLDSLGYLYTPNGEPVAPQLLSFVHYLMQRGVSLPRILHLVRNPIVRLNDDGDGVWEESLFTLTAGATSAAAHSLLETVTEVVSL